MSVTRGVPRAHKNYVDPEIEDIRRRRFQKAMALKDRIELTDEERYELAQMIPGVDKDYGGSWKELNPKQLSRLIDMMEGFVFISHLLWNRVEE